MAYDGPSRGVVLFGGAVLNRGGDERWVGDTWFLNAVGQWITVEAQGAVPSARSGHAMVWDSRYQKVVLTGGRANGEALEEPTTVWMYVMGDQTWFERPALIGPCADHALSFDALAGRLLFFGSCFSRSFVRADLGGGPSQEWTATGANPGLRRNLGLTFDPERREALVVGGNGAQAQGDLVTWRSRSGSSDLPAALWRVPFGVAHRQDVDLLSVRVEAHAGGFGHSGGQATDGARLLAWDTLDAAEDEGPGWRLLAENEAAPDAVAPLRWTTRDPELMRRAVLGEDENLHLALVPLAPNGSGSELARVAVDYLEATVDYRVRRDFGWTFDKRCLCRHWHPDACCPQGYGDPEPVCGGWEAVRVVTPCDEPEPGLWCMVLDMEEPHLLSPELAEDPRPYRYLELRLRNESADHTGLRFTWQFEGEPAIPPERGVSFEVEPRQGRVVELVRVPLDAPDWTAGDRLVRLRLDLPGGADGSELALGAIRLRGETDEVDCENGVDDDADGLVDCEDPECSAEPMCVEP